MLVLSLRNPSPIPIEAEWLRPDELASLALADIEQRTVFHGNREEPLGAFFDVHGDPSDEHLVIEGDCTKVKRIGEGMTRGTITIRGNVGMHLGAEMRGGRIEVQGHASDWVGAEMRGGVIHVRGDAGHLVGAGYRGARRGMVGGTILIEGNAGNEIGSTMRRGLIAIGGRSGDFAGVSMIAGTILLFGESGIRLGAGMKRGTIAQFGPPSPLLPTFRYDCTYAPAFLQIYLRHLRQLAFPLPAGLANGVVRRYSGDLVSLGKGEILHWQAAS